jgi:hypothetical protein
MANYKFNVYQSIYDQDITVYGLTEGGIEKTTDGVKFIEVTPDFERVSFVRADSLKVIGTTVKQY